MNQEEWSDSSGSYIRLRGDAGERIGDRILRKHCIQGVLPVEIERVNDRQEYVYETTGYRTLNETMERTPLKKDQWIELWKQVTDTLEDMEQHLMDGEHIVVDGEHIYVRGDRPEVGVICLPSHREKLTTAVIGLTEQMLRYPEVDRETSEYIYRLHDQTATGEMTRQELFMLLRGGEENMREEPGKCLPEGERNKTGRIPLRIMGGECHVTDKRNRWLAAGMLALGVLIPAVLFKAGIFVSAVTGEINYSMLSAAVVFFLSVAAYGAHAVWPRRESSPIYEADDECPSVCLIPQVTGLSVLPVMRFPWQIGRDKNLSDAVVDRVDVSPVHARIQRESESVFLIDEETASGTFLNNNRLVPWEKTRVRDGDTVSFGSTPFVVEITP